MDHKGLLPFCLTRSACVALEVNSNNPLCPGHKEYKEGKPCADITRSPNRGTNGPTKMTDILHALRKDLPELLA